LTDFQLRFPQECLVIFHNITIDSNLQIVNISSEILNDGVHATLISGSGDLHYDLLKLTARLIIRVPESDSDKRYNREIFQTSVDIEKFLKGVGGNWFTREIMKDIKSCLDFEAKLPVPKVVNAFSSSGHSHDV
jgi:hypothetical protein